MLTYLQKVKPSRDESKKFFWQIAHGLQFIHGRGFCHLDLSLENVFLSEDKDTKIADFGQARREIEVSVTKPGMIGKDFYRAPEINSSKIGDIIDGQAADVFSLGIILYILLVGNPPFSIASCKDPRFAWFQRNGFPEFVDKGKNTEFINGDVLNLLQNMLCPVERRMTIQQVIQHSYLQDFCVVPSQCCAA
jgi:serine/threonine-protein kinase Chk1